MAENLKVQVDFTASGSDKLNSDIKKTTMSAKELENELKALATEYGKLIGQMTVMKQAGLQNTAEFKNLETAAGKTKASIETLGAQYTATADKSNLFRNKALNLGTDLAVVSFSIRAVIGDLQDVANEFRNAEPSVTKLASSLGAAGLSALAMVPSLLALKKAMPVNEFTKGAGAVSLFSVAMFDAVNKADTLYKAFKNMTTGGQGFFESLGNALSSNIIGQLTQEIFGLNQEIEKSLEFMLMSGKEKEVALQRQKNINLGIDSKIVDFGLQLDKEQEAEQQDKQRREEQRSQTIALLDVEKKRDGVKKSSVGSVKQEITLLNREQEILKEIAGLQDKIAIETLPAQVSIFEGQIKQLRIQLEILKQTNAERGKMFEGVLPLGNILPTDFNAEIERMKLGVSLTNETTDTDKDKGEEKLTLSELVNRGMNFAKELTGILNIGVDSFIGKLLSGLQSAISLANSLISFLGGVMGLGADVASGGIFGLIGGLFSAPMQNPTAMGMASGRSSAPIVINMAGNLSRLGMYEITSTGGQVALRYGDRNL